MIFKTTTADNKTFIYLTSPFAEGTRRSVLYFKKNYKSLMKKHKDSPFLYLFECNSINPELEEVFYETNFDI
jgi:hypothetical protein